MKLLKGVITSDDMNHIDSPSFHKVSAFNAYGPCWGCPSRSECLDGMACESFQAYTSTKAVSRTSDEWKTKERIPVTEIYEKVWTKKNRL